MTETQELPSVPTENNKQYEGSNDADMEPSHHARRPMNAFLIFCKRHRSVVRDKYPNLENRSITKILGEWWANLDKDEKACYTGLAKQYKDAFFNAHPDFKWYKLPAPPLRTFATRPCNTNVNSNYLDQENVSNDSSDGKVKPTNNNNIIKVNYNPSTSKNRAMFTPGKLADETQMGGLSSLILTKDPDDPDADSEYLKTNCDLSKSTVTSSINHNKNESSTINYTITGPPKKRPFIEPNDGVAKEDENSCDIKLRKLQDELSETSRVFQLSYDNNKKDDYEELNRKDYGGGNSHGHDKFRHFFIQNGTNNNNISKKHQNNYPYRKNDYEQEQCKPPSKRSCKGKRYQEFMAFGGLMVNKRSKRDDVKYSNSPEPTHTWKSYEEYTNENTQKSIELINENKNNIPKSAYNDINDIDDTGQNTLYCDENSLDQSKDSDNKMNKVFKASDFDLDAKIKALPSLSLEKFQQKKRENKKRRKNMSSSKHKDYKPHLSTHFNSTATLYQPTDHSKTPKPIDMKNHTHFKTYQATNMSEDKVRLAEEHKSVIIGSRKRKPRKFSITRLDVNSPMKMQQMNIESAKIIYTNDAPIVKTTSNFIIPDQNPHMAADICGLTALAEAAEVAAKIQN